MPNTFFVGCTHFFHKNIIKFCPRTRLYCQTIEEMNERLIQSWNEQVQPDDTVYHLGDVSFKLGDKTVQTIRRLSGKIHLILGNHDKEKYYEQTGRFESIAYYHELLVDKLKPKWILCHYPIYEWNNIHRGAYHLHSHVHGRPLTHMPEGRILDVGIDNRPKGDMKLWELSEIDKLLRDKPIRNHHEGEQ